MNGFLTGILLAFEPAGAINLNVSYRAEIDGRRFEFAVHQGRLAPARGEPAVTVTASAADLLKARLGATAATRLMALERIKFDGDQDAVEMLRKVFRLTADPQVPVGVRS